MNNTTAFPRRLAGACALALLACAPLASADDHGRRMAPPLPAYEQECGACHLAFPPGLLPAQSWKSIMGSLADHYGADASLDAQTTAQLRAWLERHGGSGKRGNEAPPDARITRANWFQREHRGINATVWKHESVSSPANCAACHPQAAQGDFEEDGLVFPKGLDSRHRAAWQDD